MGRVGSMAKRASFGTQFVEVFKAAELLDAESLDVFRSADGWQICHFRPKDGVLEFRNCNVPSELQKHVCTMKDIRHLSIRKHGTSMADVTTLLGGIHNLGQLENLWLEGCYASGTGSGHLPSNLKRLELFGLRLNTILEATEKLPSLDRLSISVQWPEDLKRLARHIEGIQSLHVRLEAEASHSQFVYGLHLCITMFPHLKKLYYEEEGCFPPTGKTKLQIEEQNPLFSCLPAGKALASSQLASLTIRSDGLRTLPSHIHGLSRLSHLAITSRELGSLGEGLCSLHKLESLDVTWCDKLRSLPACLAGMENLCTVDVSNSGIDAARARKIFPDIEFVAVEEIIRELLREEKGEEEHLQRLRRRWRRALAGKSSINGCCGGSQHSSRNRGRSTKKP